MKASEEKLRNVLCLEESGGDINYSVIAGAGAGKSTMLSKRISHQIKDGESIDSFVIITYTNAAANELRDKISDELAGMLTSGALSTTEKANVENALSKIELINISTIHAFLLQILRENAFESHLALDAEMYEDEDEGERRKVFFDKWVNSHFSDLDAFRADWNIKNDKGFIKDFTREVLWGVFNDMASLREDIIIDTADHSADFESIAIVYVDKHFPQFKIFKDAVVANCPKKKDGSLKLNTEQSIIVDNISTVEGNILSKKYGLDDAILISNAYDSLIKRMKAKEKDASQAFYGKNTNDTMLDGLYPMITKDELDWNFNKYYSDYMLWSQKASLISEYALKLKVAYQAETDAETRAISNDDILYRAEKLLNDNPAILKALRAKYTKIYVDEFQDTTGCQARIVRLLSGKDGSSLTPFDPKENNLLVVGDPKQSIYRFTGAEKAVYDEVNKEISSLNPVLGQTVTLDSNFRSNEDIVAWVNGKYSKLIPAYSAMDSDWIVNEKNALHGVFKYEFDDPTGAVKYTKEIDAESVTNLIKELVSSDKYFIEDYDRKNKEYTLRRIQYSDFMVITRRATDMIAYVTQFNKEGIPLNVQGKLKLEGDEVIRNFIRVLNYFADSKNGNVRFAASQLAGRTNASKDDDIGLTTGESKLKALKDEFKKNKLKTASIVHRLLKEEELYLPDGAFDVLRVKEYKARLNQMIEACLSENDGDIAKLVKTMLSYVKKEIKKANPLESGENAVRLMNVHQAKGLTGQIVIIANRCNDEAPRYNGFKSMGKYYPAASYRPSANSSPVIRPTFGFDDSLMKKSSKEEWEESTRLEYVAATRAAHALIFMPSYGTAKNIWFTAEEYKIDSLPEIGQWINIRKKDTLTYPLVAAMTSSKTTERLDDLDSNIAKADFDIINSAVIDSITPSSLEPEGSTGYIPTDPGYVEEKDRPHRNVFGTVMHRTYELIFSRFGSLKDLDTASRKKAIKRIINQAISEQLSEMHTDDKPSEFSAYLENKMNDYFDKVIVPIMDGAEEVYPEYSFSFYVPEDEVADFKARFKNALLSSSGHKEIKTDNIWVNGQADLVVKQKDGQIKVYDYKSDAMNGKPLNLFESSLEFKYKGQLDLYKYAIGRAFGIADIATEIIHLYR